MADTSGVVTIKDIVNEYVMLTKTDYGYPEIYQIACQGIREVNLWYKNDSKRTVKLTMNTNNIVSLPSDYLSFIQVAVPLNGEYYTLTERNSIIETTTESSGAEILDPEYGEGVDVADQIYENYGSTNRNPEGYYKLDEAKRRIVFRNLKRSQVFLTYKSSGLSTSEQTVIDAKARPLIEAYIRKKVAYYKDEAISRQQLLRQVYDEERSKLIGLEMPSIFVLEDMFKNEQNQTLRK